MSGSSIKQAKDSLNAALKRLNPSDRFNIIDFDSGFETLFESAMLANNSHLNEAKRFIRKIDADGGTEMLAPIKFALKSRDSESKNYLRQIVFITDGQSGNEGAIFNTVEFDIDNEVKNMFPTPNDESLWKLASLIIDSIDTQIKALNATHVNELLSIIESSIQKKLNVIRSFRQSNE